MYRLKILIIVYVVHNEGRWMVNARLLEKGVTLRELDTFFNSDTEKSKTGLLRLDVIYIKIK